jgi:hypothetical protein
VNPGRSKCFAAHLSRLLSGLRMEALRPLSKGQPNRHIQSFSKGQHWLSATLFFLCSALLCSALLWSWQRTALRNTVRFDDLSGPNGIDIHQLARFLGGEKLTAASETCTLWHKKA